jgi:hypothetical protein
MAAETDDDDFVNGLTVQVLEWFGEVGADPEQAALTAINVAAAMIGGAARDQGDLDRMVDALSVRLRHLAQGTFAMHEANRQ